MFADAVEMAAAAVLSPALRFNASKDSPTVFKQGNLRSIRKVFSDLTAFETVLLELSTPGETPLHRYSKVWHSYRILAAMPEAAVSADVQRLNAMRDTWSNDHTAYLKQHPEITTLMNDFLSAVLLQKPADVRAFARTYFAGSSAADSVTPSCTDIDA
jgi:Regulatory subunit of type II PKA R-subunit